MSRERTLVEITIEYRRPIPKRSKAFIEEELEEYAEDSDYGQTGDPEDHQRLPKLEIRETGDIPAEPIDRQVK